MQRTVLTIALGILVSLAGTAVAEEMIFMSEPWAAAACEAWNEDELLTGGLVKWMENDLDRGYKMIQIYRMDCEESPRIELRLEGVDDEVQCTYGGLAKAELESKADYVMFAQTERWEEMGAGKYGPMKGMMFRRLRFQGPKLEAMNNMGPFKNFLLLTGQVPGDTSTCPVG
jgi:putative sterol carrier protein